MKKKIYKICGVALALVLVFSLAVAVLPANQVEADPGEVAWSSIANPGNSLRTGLNLADVDVGPIAVTPDGATLFAAVQCEAAIASVGAAGDWALLQSTDGGHNWTATDLTGNRGPITGIAISPYFATDGTMYVAAGSVPLAAPAVFRSNDSGATFIELKGVPIDSGGTLTTDINSIDMWPASPYPYVMVGTDSDVWVLQDMPFGAWMDQEIATGTGTWVDVMAVAFAPDFAVTNFIWAVVGNDNLTAIWGEVTATNSPGAWGTILANTNSLLLTNPAVSADIAFPDDYDSSTSPYLWVGLNDGADNGGVWRIRGLGPPGPSQDIPQLGVAVPGGTAVDIRSIAVSGSMASATILAGDDGAAAIYKSESGGLTWPGTAVVKQPTGVDTTYVLMAPDFATSSLAYVGTSDFGVTFDTVGAATAEWSTAESNTRIYSAELYAPDGNTDEAWVAIDTNIALKDITALSFWKFVSAYGASGFNPGIWLFVDADDDGDIDFTTEEMMALAVGFDDPAMWAGHGDDAIVWVQDTAALSAVDTVWVEWDAFAEFCWETDAGARHYASSSTLGATQSEAVGVSDPTDTVMKVVIMLGGSSLWMGQTTYIDDITIDGTTYPLEPMESAFQVSRNAGMSWNQTGLIDTDIAAINDVAVASCDTVFMVTDAFSLWKTTDATATVPIWERILTPPTDVIPTNTLTAGGWLDLVATSPEFDGDGVDDVVLVTNMGAANVGVMKSTDGGDIFTPMGSPVDPITALCVVDNTFAFTGAAGQVYRTDDGAYSWLAAIIPPAGTVESFAISPDYANDSTLLIGNGAGAIYRSVNSGATFTIVGAAIADVTNTYVAFDPEYADNSLIYAAGDGVIARYNFTATALGWVNIDAAISVGLAGASVFSYSVTAGSVTVSVANDADGDVTIVGTTVTLPDEDDAVAITAVGTVAGATVDVTPISGTQTNPGTNTLGVGASLIVTYVTGGAVTGASVINGLLTSPDGTIYGSNALAAQGVERSLNPRNAAPAPPPTFERVTDQLAATATLAGLWLVVDPALDVIGSKNVLFSIDTTGLLGVDRIKTYTDTLATTVVLTEPEDGTVYPREKAVTMKWKELTGADTYQWQIATDSKFRLVVDEGDSGYTSASSGVLAAGHTYYWRVRVADEDGVGDPLLSRWSNAPAYEPSAHWTFTTFLGERPWHPFDPMSGVNPSPGATDVPLKPTFQWNGADWATTYDLELADNSAFTGAIKKTLSTTAWTCDPALDYNTTYYWKVKAVSDVTESEWTDVGVFTTVAEVVPPAKAYSCPQCGLQFDTEAALKAHWDKFHAPPTPVKPITPAYIWAIIAVGALLVVAVIVLIVRTRRVA